jgi:hypothetical protein
MQRHFLSLGLNATEDGVPAYDGFLVHVAGARRGAFNHRFAQPSNQTTPTWGHVFPYGDLPSDDTLTGRRAGLLDRVRELGAAPKVIYTNSSAEYWRGDGALAHVDTEAAGDLPEAATSRSYLFASTQHVSGYPGQPRRNADLRTFARYPLNVIDYRPLLRAALENLDRWVTGGEPPPPSRHPRLEDGTAVERSRVLAYFSGLPGFHPPAADRLPFVRTVDLGGDESAGVGRYPAREGAFYPALVCALDEDGNEAAGIRLPDVEVPVATNAGGNPRDPESGSPDQIVPRNGLSIFFAASEAERTARGDPRPSLAARYTDAADYERRVRAVAQRLVGERYLLAEDVELVVANALDRYRAALASGEAAQAAD